MIDETTRFEMFMIEMGYIFQDRDVPIKQRIPDQFTYIQDILKTPSSEWNWWFVSSHHTITMEDIDAHPELPWDWEYVSLNPNLTMNYVVDHPDKSWDMEEILAHSNITLNDIVTHPEYPWITDYWEMISRNPNLTIEFVLAHRENRELDWHYISEHPNITMTDIEMCMNHKSCYWRWEYISRNPNLTLSFVLAHPDKPWDWNAISKNPSITMEDIDAHPTQPWKWMNVSTNLNLTLRYVLDHPDRDWSTYSISKNPAISVRDIKTHRAELDAHPILNSVILSFQNPNLTTDIILETPCSQINENVYYSPCDCVNYRLMNRRDMYMYNSTSIDDFANECTNVL